MTKVGYVVTAVLLAGLGAACYTTHSIPANQLVDRRTVPRVWVTHADKTISVFDAPQVEGDTLSGLVLGEPERIPLSDAVTIKARSAAPVRTVALAVAASAALMGTFLYLESRPDVGDVHTCSYSILGTLVNPCCGTSDSTPC